MHAKFPNSEPWVAVIILNWRRSALTLACLQSVAASEYEQLKIYICDNNSQDGSYEDICVGLLKILPDINASRNKKDFAPFIFNELPSEGVPNYEVESRPPQPTINLLQTGFNGGYAFGNNKGMRAALLSSSVHYIWILNNDTVVVPSALSAFVSTMQADPDIGICGSLVCYLENPSRVQTAGGGRFLPFRARCEQIAGGINITSLPSKDKVESSLDYINGASSFVSRQLIDTVGLMDENFFLYYEEIDWATRARAKGFKLGYCPTSIVLHKVGAATGTSDNELPSTNATYYAERSKFRFLRKHHPWVMLIAFPLLVKTALGYLANGHWSTTTAILRGGLGLSKSSDSSTSSDRL